MRVLALVLFVFVQLDVCAAETIVLRVLCYNIHHAEGVDRELDVERIARVINQSQPDLVALQEVDQRVKRTERIDQPKVLARLTKMQVVFGANIDLQGGHYGNAVLSRYPILNNQNHPLPNFDRGEQRGLLETHINVPGLSKPLIFLATHLDHRPDDQERVASATAINSLLKKHKQYPAILAGDFNDVRGSETLQELEKQWTHTVDKSRPTVPVREPSRQIDFVLMRPASGWTIRNFEVLGEAIASDHRAILAILELNK